MTEAEGKTVGDRETYSITQYERPSLPADVVILAVRSEVGSERRRMLPERTLEALLIYRKNWPYQHCWALPGGFSQPNERVEETARRELFTETGMTDVYLELLDLYSTPGRDPRGWVIAATYFALIPGNPPIVHGGDDAEDARWFPVSDILRWPQGNPEGDNTDASYLAFDHRIMLADALTAIRKKLHTSLLVKELLPERFTLAELYQVIQVIDETFSEERPNFMRKLLHRHIVEETGTFDDRYSQRPAKQYRFTEDMPPVSIYQ